MSSPETSGIVWPQEFDPEPAPVHVRNEIEIAAPSERVWAWLIRAPIWPTWYRNSKGVRILSGLPPDLRLATRFHWWTFGVPITSEVREFVPCERLAWDAHGLGVRAYHAWLISPTARGCHVLTEETQHGWGAQLQAFLMPNRMSKHHQIWLEALRERAEGGLPPGGGSADVR
jgi:uncharacterized protein YndB with AHSA1/START domain